MPIESAGGRTSKLSRQSPADATTMTSSTAATNVIINSGVSAADDAGTAATSSTSRDVTFKPKPIKAQRHVDNTILTYQKIPIFAFNSPKNPHGLSPFQPTGIYGGFVIVHLFSTFFFAL